jgi:fused signal recognition particle receptor
MANLLQKWIDGLEKTRKVTFGKISQIIGTSEITQATWGELETNLIQADMGVQTTHSVISSLKKTISDNGITQENEFNPLLKAELSSRLALSIPLNLTQPIPIVILLVGVNGSGKTTTAAKLGSFFTSLKKKVLLVAADTYRAAAIDQLQVWAERVNIPIIIGAMGSDPGAVAYDGVSAAVSRGFDVVIIDTAGRLHTRYNLMEELKKVHRVVSKAHPGAPHYCWLVLDATTGQNALMQAKTFKEAVEINGVILTKLDTSARGGMVFSIQDQIGLPIVFAGLGEKTDDLQMFDRDKFITGIFPD